jgi:hypothetical protein
MKSKKNYFFYANKWQNLILSSDKIDKTKAENAVKLAYSIMGYEEPIIIFADSLTAALEYILSLKSCLVHGDIQYLLGYGLWSQIKNQLSQQVVREIRWQNDYLGELINQIKHPIIVKFIKPAIDRLSAQYRVRLIRLGINTVPEKYDIYGSQADYGISVLKCNYNLQKWEIFKSLVSNCGLTFCFKQPERVDDSITNLINIVVICDRPMI